MNYKYKQTAKLTQRRKVSKIVLALAWLATVAVLAACGWPLLQMASAMAGNDAVCRAKPLPMNSFVSDVGTPVRFPFVDPDGDELSVTFHRDAERFAVEQPEPNQLTVVYLSDVPGTYYMDITVADDRGAKKEVCVRFDTYYPADFNKDGKVDFADFQQFSREWSRLRKP